MTNRHAHRPRGYSWIPVFAAGLVWTWLQTSFLFAAELPPPSLALNADRQYSYAEHLFQKGEDFRAIGEYERFLFFFPQDPRTETARYRIGEAYFHSQRYAQAADAFEALIRSAPETTLALQAQLMISEAHRRLGALGQAVQDLRNLLAVSENPGVRDEAYYRMGWVYIDMGQWQNAREAFRQIRVESRPEYRIERILSEVDRLTPVPRKNPTLAGGLSIVPGLGYLYVGRYRDALTAFLINTGLILASVESFGNDSPALGGVLAFVGAGFYSGNIYGAAGSAHKYNEAQTAGVIQHLKSLGGANLSVAPRRDPSGIALTLSWRF